MQLFAGERVLLFEDICMTGHPKLNGGKGYGNLLEFFLPLLRDGSDKAIHKTLIANPSRAIARAARYGN
ncbi:MAG: hypothetical protein AB7O62_24455 [Pirellulales bacterium]